jgi:hypothetical protein
LGNKERGRAQFWFSSILLRIEPQTVYGSLHQQMMHLTMPGGLLQN